jgi:hypothetical protein
MAGPGLSVTNDTTYADSGTDLSVKIHQQDHDAIGGIVNDFDIANFGTAGYVPIGNGTVFVARAFLSTDNPGIVINTRTANYTLVLSDAGKLVEMNVASANTLTVPPDSSVNFPIGTVIPGSQEGAGITTITASGNTIHSRGEIKTTAGQYAEFSLRKRAANDWRLSGDLG